jgi:hypothetical protein
MGRLGIPFERSTTEAVRADQKELTIFGGLKTLPITQCTQPGLDQVRYPHRPAIETYPWVSVPEEKPNAKKPRCFSPFSLRTVITAQGARCTTTSEILPSIALLNPLRFRLPMTIRSASRSLADSTISSATFPNLRWAPATAPAGLHLPGQPPE